MPPSDSRRLNMSNFVNSFVGYSEGEVNVLMYDGDKIFLPGDEVKIRISSHVKLTKVSYCWNNGKRTQKRVFFNRCWFKVRIPRVSGNKPVLRVISEVQFKNGLKREHEHTFEINSMH